METRRRPLVYVVVIVVALGLIGWLGVRSVAKQRLLRDLGSNDIRVRVRAARRLLDTEKLVDALPAQPVIRRSKAAEALGEIGTEEAIQALGVILQDQEEAPKRWARQALVKIGKRSVPTFMAALAVGGGTKDEAVKGLVELGPGVAPEIRFLLTDRVAYKAAAEALAQLGETGIQALIDGCYVVDKDLRKAALANLGKQRVRVAVPAALDNLKKGTFTVAGSAIAALGLIGDRRAARDIIPFLTNKDERQGAATALGLLRDPQAVDPLLATLMETQKAYRDAAILALRRIGVAALPALTRELKSPEVLMRRAAASGMVGTGSPTANAALGTALKDPDEEVRVSAALALGWKGNVAAAGALVQALSDGKWRVVDAAVTGLGEMGTEAIGPLLAVLSQPGAVEVHYQLSRALAQMGRPAVPRLVAELATAPPEAQKWVAAALGEIGDPRAVEALKRLEANATGDLKWVAQEQLRVLAGMGGS